ncbi:hypothetical protein [Rhizobium sp. G21]|uniref:hypothetical protein n=1 Tax=Rhizobium sp. G21 TaxID=2758439 RepID=UPI001FEE93FE|nr:hypothetical protein [Rhizobium sp. G21]
MIGKHRHERYEIIAAQNGDGGSAGALIDRPVDVERGGHLGRIHACGNNRPISPHESVGVAHQGRQQAIVIRKCRQVEQRHQGVPILLRQSFHALSELIETAVDILGAELAGQCRFSHSPGLPLKLRGFTKTENQAMFIYE